VEVVEAEDVEEMEEVESTPRESHVGPLPKPLLLTERRLEKDEI
jgi:hypothetical protein